MGKKLRKREAGVHARPEEEVRAALRKELEDYLKGRPLERLINPLLGLQGGSFLRLAVTIHKFKSLDRHRHPS